MSEAQVWPVASAGASFRTPRFDITDLYAGFALLAAPTGQLHLLVLLLQVPQISVLEQELAVKAAKAKADMQAAAAAADMQQFAGVQPDVSTPHPLKLPPPPDVS